MNTRIVCAVAVVLASCATGVRAQHAPHASLPAFGSERELSRYLASLAPPAPAAPQPPAPQTCTAVSPAIRPELAWEGPSSEWPAVVSGRVTNANGCPEAAVLVRIESLNAGTTTAADGTYRLMVPAARIHAGQAVNLTVSRTGLAPATRSITLSPGVRLTQDFHVSAEILLLEDVVVAGSAGAGSVTNNQHDGVDEGAIVKLHGDFLVILRRGRLFTVDVGGGSLRPVSMIDAFAPDEEDPDAWYDEMLVSGNLVVVIGYSYERGGTEISLFRIDRAGRLHYRETHHLRSDDYYSSRNYASRLIGTRLVMYAPVPAYAGEPGEWMPAVRRWRPGAEDGEFRRILRPGRVYRPGRRLHWNDGPTLHTVTTCELGRGRFECEATAVLGPEGRVFYVSRAAVYVWTSDWRPLEESAPSVVYRIPLDGGASAALQVEGSPVDQFSFLESEDGHLNVLVRSDAHGDGMWRAERAGGDVRLLRVPIRRFGAGRATAAPRDYRTLPTPANADEEAFHNRFVGSYLLYGTGGGWWEPSSGPATLHAVRWTDGRLAEVPLAHPVDRIEVMGGDAVVVGADSADLHFTGIRLGRQPRAAQRYVQRGAQQGELRSHGFFYRADGPQEGVMGLPVRRPGAPGYEHLFHESASVLFLQNEDEQFRALGELAADPEDETDDGCIVSCVDWYGNARPLFLRGRILALLGYEIVEGAVMDGRIREVQRARFTPSAALAANR
ncbi:MAG TPA: beta-propeller domain-containing protein [Longimicrobium sp.]|nr:beta-propeller domain-containing protein [Longimicrobium sp.]